MYNRSNNSMSDIMTAEFYLAAVECCNYSEKYMVQYSHISETQNCSYTENDTSSKLRLDDWTLVNYDCSKDCMFILFSFYIWLFQIYLYFCFKELTNLKLCEIIYIENLKLFITNIKKYYNNLFHFSGKRFCIKIKY